MSLLSLAFDSRYPVLLCLAVGGFCLWRYTRRSAPAFHAPGALLAVLLLVHPPLLLLIRFSMARDVALPFTLALFSSSLLLLHAVGPAFRLVLPPPRWGRLTGALLVLDAAIAAGWSYIPSATLLLPDWLTAVLVLGGEAGFMGLLLYWFWHAQRPGGPWSLSSTPLSPVLALAQQAYDQQAADFQPTKAEFEAWLRTLRPPAQRLAQQAGMKAMWTVPLFRRFVLEARGYRCVDFMAEHLAGKEFRRWVDAVHTPQ